MPFIDDVSGVFAALNLDEETIRVVMSALRDGETIKAKELARVKHASYGQSDAGRLLAFHTDLAHQKVVEAMEDMLTGLHGLGENVQAFGRHFGEVDAGTGDDLHRGAAKVGDIPSVAASTDCTASPTVSTSTCSIPGGN